MQDFLLQVSKMGVKESDELLIYFIRIEKDSLNDYKFAGREFEVK